MFEDGVNWTAAGIGLLVGGLALLSVTSDSAGWDTFPLGMKFVVVFGAAVIAYLVAAYKLDGGV